MTTGTLSVAVSVPVGFFATPSVPDTENICADAAGAPATEATTLLRTAKPANPIRPGTVPAVTDTAALRYPLGAIAAVTVTAFASFHANSFSAAIAAVSSSADCSIG